MFHPLCFPLAEKVIGMAVNEAGEASEGGVVKLTAISNFLVIEAGVVMLGGGLKGVVLRGVGLNDDPAPRVPRPALPATWLKS